MTEENGSSCLNNQREEFRITFYDKPALVPKYWQEKYNKDAAKYWDKFYKHNTTHFFKDRHWILREFPELNVSSFDDSSARKVVLDVGCGVGNTVFPLLEVNPQLFFWAVDFSPRAISLLKANSRYCEDKCKAFVVDVTKDPLPPEIADNSVDFVTLIFVLSAIAPEMMDIVLGKVYKVLKPGGLVLFRDYAAGDEAQQRFAEQDSSKKKLGENFYVRRDGTLAYFFTQESVRLLFERNSFEVVATEYVKRQVENRKHKLQMNRLWIQGKFKKCALSTPGLHSPNTNAMNGRISDETSNFNGESAQFHDQPAR